MNLLPFAGDGPAPRRRRGGRRRRPDGGVLQQDVPGGRAGGPRRGDERLRHGPHHRPGPHPHLLPRLLHHGVRRVHPAGRVSVGRRPGEGVVGERVHPARPADDRRGQGEPRGHVPAHGVVLRHPVVRGARCGGGGGAAELRGARRAARRHALPDGRPAGQLPGAGAHGAAADGAVREPGPVAAGPGDALRRALHRGRALLHVLQPHLRLLQDGGHRPVAGPGVRAAAAEDLPAAQAGRHPAAGAQGELRRAHRGEAGQRLLPGAAGAAEPADLGQHAGAGPADEAAGGAVRQGRRAVPAEVRGGDAEGEQAGRDRQEEQGADQAGLPDGEQGQGGPLDAHPLSQAPQAPHAPDDQLVHPWLPAGLTCLCHPYPSPLLSYSYS
ncbi:hypothetical protein CFC21_108756 [Triticum aestivum]|uniref:Uncharacterized protein n=2 Tax=Triticum aestivum TaxID=4565 RepID=A0A9R1MIY5_WHEAT|nr:hypothetical protein CFC21_108756 [Triticum aestivum]